LRTIAAELAALGHVGPSGARPTMPAACATCWVVSSTSLFADRSRQPGKKVGYWYSKSSGQKVKATCRYPVSALLIFLDLLGPNTNLRSQALQT